MERVVESFVAEISDVEHCLDTRRLRLRSRDRHAVSPLLASSLKGKVADISVTPKTLDEVKRVVAAAATRRIPITVKGGGTANYGQSVPLHGGILLEMHRLDDIRFVGADAIRVGAGLTFGRLDAHAQQSRRELRIHPSTRQTASVGGHLAGGQGGPGSVTHGVLSDPGNVLAVQIVTMEVEPRVLELRGGDVQRVYHTYGTTGIITEVELPLAPAYRWREAVVAFGEFATAARFAVAVATSGLRKKVVSLLEGPLPGLVTPFARCVPDGFTSVAVMIDDDDWTAFEERVSDHGGQVVATGHEGRMFAGAPLTEFTFGHALAQVQKNDPSRVGVEGFFRAADLVAQIAAAHTALRRFGPLRLEFIRMKGRLVATGSPLFSFEAAAQLDEVIRTILAVGGDVANSHSSHVRSVGKKIITDADVSFKSDVDPLGLLNPGRFDFGAAQTVPPARSKHAR